MCVFPDGTCFRNGYQQQHDPTDLGFGEWYSTGSEFDASGKLSSWDSTSCEASKIASLAPAANTSGLTPSGLTPIPCDDATKVMMSTFSGKPDHLPEMCVDANSVAAVRCCSTSGAKVEMSAYFGSSSSSSPCFKQKTFQEADAICSRFNLRLCTRLEVIAGNSSSTGCGFDEERIWTSTTCDEPGKVVLKHRASMCMLILCVCR